jgi:hypothetical protein
MRRGQPQPEGLHRCLSLSVPKSSGLCSVTACMPRKKWDLSS